MFQSGPLNQDLYLAAVLDNRIESTGLPGVDELALKSWIRFIAHQQRTMEFKFRCGNGRPPPKEITWPYSRQ
jgi:hypothetical protein